MMTTTFLSSRDFHRDSSGAKKAASLGPVFITEAGKPAYVLLSIDDYRRLGGKGRSIVEALSMPGLSTINVEF